jgi:plasmid stabilization system protein ParE
MKLKWSDRARRDLIEINRFIARDDPDAARQWIRCLRQRARRAAQMSRAGRVVPEFGRPDVREVLIYGYRIVYLVRRTEIVILTVFEGHRLLRP